MWRDDAGVMRKQMDAEDMLAILNVNDNEDADEIIPRKKKIRNKSNILNLLSAI